MSQKWNPWIHRDHLVNFFFFGKEIDAKNYNLSLKAIQIVGVGRRERRENHCSGRKYYRK
jgi:hypothetical protein